MEELKEQLQEWLRGSLMRKNDAWRAKDGEWYATYCGEVSALRMVLKFIEEDLSVKPPQSDTGNSK